MADSSWDNSESLLARRKGRPVWMKWGLGILGAYFGLNALLGLVVGASALQHRKEVWPVTLRVHQRLQSDEGARELYRKNPSLKGHYADEDGFLQVVQSWRPKLGQLPAHEPPRKSEDFVQSADPVGFDVSAKGSGGAWLNLRVDGSFLGEGEGLSELIFSDDRHSLRASRKEARENSRAEGYQRFKDVAKALKEDEQSSALWKNSSKLHKGFRDEAAFLQALKIWRSDLPSLPESYAEASQKLGVRRMSLFANQSLEMKYPKDGPKTLSMVWLNDELSEIKFEHRADASASSKP
jgi:hypothetical protein